LVFVETVLHLYILLDGCEQTALLLIPLKYARFTIPLESINMAQRTPTKPLIISDANILGLEEHPFDVFHIISARIINGKIMNVGIFCVARLLVPIK
jgi:hypothetical protein